MKMFNPPHPGLTIREDVLQELGLTVTDAARQLGVSRVALSRVINGRAAISAEMAIRFAQWLGGSAEIWLRLQMQYDLWQAEEKKDIAIKPVVRRVQRRHADMPLSLAAIWREEERGEFCAWPTPAIKAGDKNACQRLLRQTRENAY